MRGWLALALASVLVLGGCTPPPAALPAPDAALARFYAQQLAWSNCGGRDCAVLTVPLDYAHPDGQTLTLSVLRRRASETRVGTIVVNPGGPGVSATVAGDWFDTTGLDAYDIVGWDPRGTDASAPVRCLSDEAMRRGETVDASPDTPDERAALLAFEQEFADACAARTPPGLLAHVSTQESARDLDILRAALGEERLTYYGASYGTLLGAWYAEFFGGRVARMVLDAPVDITTRSAITQSAGLDAALRRFSSWCGGEAGCPWGNSEATVYDALASWLRGLDAAPVPVGDRRLNQDAAAYGVARFLYGGRPAWPDLRSAIRSAQAGDAVALLAAGDQLQGRRPDGTVEGWVAAGTAIYCLDQPRQTGTALDATAVEASGSLFGYLMGPNTGCTAWPVPAQRWVTPRAADAPAILIVGTVGDPATPYDWARTTAATLAHGVLLTVDGDGHTAYGRGNACVDAAVRTHVGEGTLPAPWASCR